MLIWFWLWILINLSDNNLSNSNLTGESLIKALDFPLFKISRLIIVFSSKSISFDSKKLKKEFLGIWNSPSTIHFLNFGPTILWSILDPEIKFKAPKIIDFPAPVSPVITEKPLLKSIDISYSSIETVAKNLNNNTELTLRATVGDGSSDNDIIMYNPNNHALYFDQKKNPIESCKMLLNGTERFTTLFGDYFNL